MSEPTFAAAPPAGTVEVRPSGLHFDVAAGESVFAAAARAGLRWPTVCGGNGTCGTCVSTVVEGDEHCSPVGDLEQETFAVVLRQRDRQDRRLVCQLRITGPVTVSKRGVRPGPAAPAPP
jgi:2Fe-2S ferredoxin